MKQLLFVSFIFLSSFNIVDRLANPFYYEDDAYTYQQQINSEKTDSKISTAIFIIIASILILVLPPSPRYSRYRGYRYYDDPEFAKKIDTIGTAVAETAVKLFQKVYQKKYFKFSNKELDEKELELKQMLSENNINYEEIIKFANSAILEMFKYLKGEENKFFQISTKPLYKKISDKIYSPLPHTTDYQIVRIYLVNFRYSIYEKAFSVYLKYKTSMDEDERGIFVTFIEDEGFKISSIEKEGESYVMKLDSFFTTDTKFSLLNKDKLKQLKPQIKIAEIFYDVYTWWKEEKELNENLFSNKELYLKLISAKENIKKEKLGFNISKIRVSNIEILNIREDFSSISIKIIARIIFIIEGSFLKDNIILIDKEEKSCDEIWEFDIKEDKIYIASIIKKEGNIQPNPLQIEWHI